MEAYKRLALILIAVLLFACCFPNAVLAASGDKIMLGAWDRTESLAFQMTNMVPGDTEMKEYAVTISDKRAIAVRFAVELHGTDDTLAEVLHIKVEKNDSVLYDGTLEKMPALTENLTGKLPQTLNYRITVSLDTSVGNEYMGETLSVDFNWSIEREPYTPMPPMETTTTVRTNPIETTSETTATELTTEVVTTETTPIETTTQSEESTTVETTTAETTSQTTSETTSHYEETTTEFIPPIIGEPCCECCVGYGFPYSCNFGSFGENDIGCDLPWCCAGGNDCCCPWCWIIPLIILIALIVVIIIIIRKLTKKKEEEEEDADEQATE